MKYKPYYLVLSFIVLLSNQHMAWSQITGGSPYSYFGVGTINESGSGLNRMLGGAGIALRDSFDLNLANPAAYNSIFSRFSQVTSTGLCLSTYSLSEDYNTYRNTEFTLDHLALWFRVFNKSGLVIGLSPYSKVNYNIYTTNSLTGLTGNYHLNYIGTGGLSKVYAGSSVELIKNLSIGINLSYIFGSVGKEINLLTDDYGQDYSLSGNTYLHSWMLDFGGQYTLNLGRHRITFGGIYNQKIHLNGEYNYDVSSGESLIYESAVDEDGYSIPESFGIGLTYATPKRLLFTFDYLQKKWSDVSFDTEYNFRDSEKYAFGMHIRPDYSSMNYFNRLGWGFGGFYNKTYLFMNNQGIDDYGFSCGVQIPIGINATIDIAYDNSLKALYTDNLVQETKHNICFNFNLFSIWSTKRRYR